MASRRNANTGKGFGLSDRATGLHAFGKHFGKLWCWCLAHDGAAAIGFGIKARGKRQVRSGKNFLARSQAQCSVHQRIEGQSDSHGSPQRLQRWRIWRSPEKSERADLVRP